jgi:hypothetical protein
MAVTQLFLRDTRENMRVFFDACGSDTSFLRFEPTQASVRLTGSPFEMSFAGFVPLVSKKPSQGVLDLLEPELPAARQSEFWGSTAPLGPSVLRLRNVLPAKSDHPHPGWRGTGGEMLEIVIRLACRGVPLLWYRQAATQIRWSKLLWANDAMDLKPWSPQQYGGAFASWDGDYDQIVGPHPNTLPQPAFLTVNGWIAGLDFSLDPIGVDDPSFWNAATVLPT